MTFPCPECGGDSGVTDVRRRASDTGSFQRRRYQCTTCQHRFTTHEMLGEYPEILPKIYELLSRLPLIPQRRPSARVIHQPKFIVPEDKRQDFEFLTRTKKYRVAEAAKVLGLKRAPIEPVDHTLNRVE